MRTLTLTDDEALVLLWGLQLGLATAIENPHPNTEKLREKLMALNQKVTDTVQPLAILFQQQIPNPNIEAPPYGLSNPA